MTQPHRESADAQKINPADEADSHAAPTNTDEATRPERTSGDDGHVADDAAGDEGIDEPAAHA